MPAPVLDLPTPGASNGVWATKLNAALTALASAVGSLTDTSMRVVVYTGTAWPARPTANATDATLWIDPTGTAAEPVASMLAGDLFLVAA